MAAIIYDAQFCMTEQDVSDAVKNFAEKKLFYFGGFDEDSKF